MLIYRVIFLSLLLIIPVYLPPTTVITDKLGYSPVKAQTPVKTIENASYKTFEPMAAIPVSPLEYIQAEAGKYGWGSGSEWVALQRLVGNESGLNPIAQNPTSSAFGLYQFLDSTWGLVGCTKTVDPAEQSRCGMLYIARTYTTPSNALSKWLARSPHWY